MTEFKKIIVFGASGQTGLKLLKRGLEEGFQMSAFVRTPSKIPEELKDRLHKIIQGDARDPKAVADAINGHDAVLSAIGNKLKFGTKLVSITSQNIIEGMRQHQVKHLQIISGAMYIREEGGCLEAIGRRISAAGPDHVKQLKNLEKANDIDWIAICPYRIEDSSKIHPNYKVWTKVRGVTWATTAELADFMITVLLDPAKANEHRHSKIVIEYYRQL